MDAEVRTNEPASEAGLLSLYPERAAVSSPA